MRRDTRLAAGDRLQMLQEAAAILAGTRAVGVSLQAIVARCAKLAVELSGTAPGGEGAPEEAARIEASLAELEAAFLDMDRKVPMTEFRNTTRLKTARPAALTRYAALLARNLGDDADRRDRIDFLVASVVAPLQPDGTRKLRERAEVSLSLNYVAGGRRCSAERRRAILDAFAAARARVEAMTDVEELF